MAWFLNPFNVEFRGSLLVGDRVHLPTFICPPHSGRSPESVESYTAQPWDLSGNDADGNATENLSVAIETLSPGLSTGQWTTITVDIAASAATSSAVTAAEVVAALQADDVFSTHFTARDVAGKVHIRLRNAFASCRYFVVPGTADTVLLFNKKAGVAELPNIFKRDKLTTQMSTAEQDLFTEFSNSLYLLDPQASGGSSTVDNTYISGAVDLKNKPLNHDPSVTQEDYQLLKAKIPFFSFKKQTVDGSNRITSVIEYPCGAKPGLMVKKTVYTYTGANTSPSEIFELPYILESGDLITPP